MNPLTNVTDTSGTAVATGVWLLRTSVDITNGVLFEVKGTDAFGGGDCDRVSRVCFVLFLSGGYNEVGVERGGGWVRGGVRQ